MSDSHALLEYVIDASRTMAETHDLDALLPYVMDEVLRLVEAEHGYIVLIDEAGHLDFKAKRHHVSTHHRDDEMSRSILRAVVEQGDPLVLGNAKMDPRFANATSVLSYNLRSVMCVPLITRERTIGAIYVENRSIEGLFVPDDVKPLMLFANHAAAAIENARLLTNLEELVAERTKELAEAKARAEAANRAKSSFLATMSHELRTPLNSILGYAQILQRQTGNEVLQQDGLATIYNSGQHLLTLIEDLLDIAKIEANKLTLRTSALPLRSFLTEVMNIVEMSARAKGLRFQFHTAFDLPELVRADAKRLRQVLLNLLGNAVKFTNEGYVALSVSRVAPAVLDETGRTKIRFEITDSGIGIDPETMATMFLPFEQGSTHETGVSGTGLGLAISQELVMLMGGEIEVESEPGRGSRFWFTIPLAVIEDAGEADSWAATITGYRGERRLLLVADDRRENRLVLTRLLEPLGFKVILAADGQEAVEQAIRFVPDLILMDLIMPVMTGLEAIPLIRARPALADTPIIAVSASALEAARADSERVGFNEFLHKPVAESKLLVLLQQHLALEWITDDKVIKSSPADDPTSSPADITPPSESELRTLYVLARMGDIGGLEGQLNELTAQSGRYANFTEHVSHLAARYDFLRIQTFLQTYLSDGGLDASGS